MFVHIRISTNAVIYQFVTDFSKNMMFQVLVCCNVSMENDQTYIVLVQYKYCKFFLPGDCLECLEPQCTLSQNF